MSEDQYSKNKHSEIGGIELDRVIDSKGVKYRTFKFKNGNIVKQARSHYGGSLRYLTVYSKTINGGVKTEKFRDEKGRLLLCGLWD